MPKITFEIWDENTNEILVDGLTFGQAAEQCKIYQEFFGRAIAVVIRETSKVHNRFNVANEYKTEYINYFAQLQQMGNLL